MKIKTILLLSLGLSSSGCVGIYGTPYNEEDQCWEESVEVSSKLSILPGGCDDGAVITKKDGVYWLFSNQCIPSGYALAAGEETEKLTENSCDE